MERIVWIARHGHREDSLDHNWKKTAENPHDPDLSQDGVTQAKELANRISNEYIDHIFASPYLRAIRTAHYCALRVNVKIKIEEGLGEMLNPQWFSRKPSLDPITKRAEVFPLINVNYQSIVVPKYPESDDEIDDRCRRVIYGILKEFEGNILLVGHGASCISIVRSLCNCPLNIDIPLCSLTKIVGSGEKWELITHANTADLTLS